MKAKSELMRALRQRRRSAHLCISCGKPAPSATRCPECLEKDRLVHRLPPLERKCQECGKDCGSRERYCPSCAPAHRVAHAQKYWRRREQDVCPHCGRTDPFRLRYNHRTLMHGSSLCHICKMLQILNADIRRGDPGPRSSRAEPILNFWTDLWSGEEFLRMTWDRLDGVRPLYGTMGRRDGDYGEPPVLSQEIREEILTALEKRGIPRQAARPWTNEESEVLARAGSLEGFRSLRYLAAALAALRDRDPESPLPLIRTGYEE